MFVLRSMRVNLCVCVFVLMSINKYIPESVSPVPLECDFTEIPNKDEELKIWKRFWIL